MSQLGKSRAGSWQQSQSVDHHLHDLLITCYKLRRTERIAAEAQVNRRKVLSGGVFRKPCGLSSSEFFFRRFIFAAGLLPGFSRADVSPQEERPSERVVRMPANGVACGDSG